MKKFFTGMLFALGLMVAGEVNAQTKIGYISSQEVVSIMPEARKADSLLTDFKNALIQNATDKQNAFYAAIDKFNKDSATLSDAVKVVKRTELTKMGQELGGEEERIQQQLQQKQQELIQPINRKAYEAIQAVAKEHNYAFVFEKEALLVAPPAEDILPLVAKKLNIKLPTAAGGNQPAAKPTTPKQ
ncbi:OmpH family outer membrane protein [Pseudoflavitalea sp. X16]|uniref:OmpH family outer membrane protein n=1 Tax=Paraflavitalea devenefica TaxID=2716334 RepID=UPI00141ED340|nr:OmpH family outer membrane protein [Paraflavitalea devenefica]NII24691.1 OmpH family outer membrane protein [Paraflavitalea devenefica]